TGAIWTCQNIIAGVGTWASWPGAGGGTLVNNKANVAHQWFNSFSGPNFTSTQPTAADVTNAVSTASANTMGAFLTDFTLSTLKLPASSGFTATALSQIGIDTSGNAAHIWTGV